MRKSLKVAEREIESNLSAELARHLQLASEVYGSAMDAIDYITSHVSPVPEAARVRLALLAKLVSDLRATAITATKGYGTQAATIASSLYETAFLTVYIGTDDALAREWREHGKAKPTEFFRSPWVLTEGSLRRLGVQDVDRLTAARYRIYSEMCLAKHNNAVMVAQHVIRRDGEDVGLLAGPDGSDVAIRTATAVLEHSIALAHLAVASLIEDFAAPDAQATLGAKLRGIMDRWETIASASRQRWPGGDPFPGKWRVAKKRARQGEENSSLPE
jgi:hypothetical protein